MSDYSNIPTGLNITSQIPLDVKLYSINEATLANLGVDNNKAYTYYQDMFIYCLQERTTYQWREVQIGESNTGLLITDFIYPNNLTTFGVNYSNRVFNFFLVTSVTAQNIENIIGTLPTGPQGPIGLNGINGTNGINGVDGVDGINGIDGTNGLNFENLVKIITVSTNYTLSNIDDNYTIIINNNIDDITITVPTGLTNVFSCILIQDGTGKVNLIESGTTISYLIGAGKTLIDQGAWAVLQKVLGTEEYKLGGNIRA